MTNPARKAALGASSALRSDEEGQQASIVLATETGAVRRHTVDLPLPPKECHQNRSGRTTGWRETAHVVRDARNFACLTSLMQSSDAMCPRWTHCRVSLHFRFPDRRRRDIFNYAGACKPYLDGLVDAGVMADDSGIEWGEIGRCIDRENPGVTVTIWPVEGE